MRNLAVCCNKCNLKLCITWVISGGGELKTQNLFPSTIPPIPIDIFHKPSRRFSYMLALLSPGCNMADSYGVGFGTHTKPPNTRQEIENRYVVTRD